MKILPKALVGLLIVVFTFGLAWPSYAATTPDLGQAASFGILSSTYTNTVGGTTITGDLGYTTGPATAPTVNGTTYSPPSTKYSTAGTDQASALSDLNSQLPCDFSYAAGAIDLASDVTTPDGVGQFTPGIYCIDGAASIGGGGTITLTGAGTYIFRITGALTTSASSIVALAGGADACDVFWTPGGATTLGANSTFIGTDIDDSGITIGSTVAWTGRALAFGGTVSTDTDTITVPTCTVASTPTPAPPASTTSGSDNAGGFSTSDQVPAINLTKSANPTELPDGPGQVAYTYQITNPGDLPLSDVTLTDNRCISVLFLSGDRNSDSLLDLDEIWTYRCTTLVSASVTNTARAHGFAEGVDVYDTAQATVVVSNMPPTLLSPPLPATGFAPVFSWVVDSMNGFVTFISNAIWSM